MNFRNSYNHNGSNTSMPPPNFASNFSSQAVQFQSNTPYQAQQNMPQQNPAASPFPVISQNNPNYSQPHPSSVRANSVPAQITPYTLNTNRSINTQIHENQFQALTPSPRNFHSQSFNSSVPGNNYQPSPSIGNNNTNQGTLCNQNQGTFYNAVNSLPSQNFNQFQPPQITPIPNISQTMLHNNFQPFLNGNNRIGQTQYNNNNGQLQFNGNNNGQLQFNNNNGQLQFNNNNGQLQFNNNNSRQMQFNNTSGQMQFNNNNSGQMQFNNSDTWSANQAQIQKTSVPDLNIFNNPNALFATCKNNNISNSNTNNSNRLDKNMLWQPSKRKFNDEPHSFKRQKVSPRKSEPHANKDFSKFKSVPYPSGGKTNNNLIDIQVVSDDQESVHEIKTETVDSDSDFSSRNSYVPRSYSNRTQNSYSPNKSYENMNNSKAAWMTESIEAALEERNRLYKEAQRTKDSTLWNQYHVMKSQIDLQIRQAKNKSGNPTNKWGNQRNKFGNSTNKFKNRNDHQITKELPYSCDTCDRSFATDVEFKEHCSLHIKCYFDGCKFEAHPKVVALHQKMQHETGYAEEINNLETDEDIKKWREERRKRFPTAENILKRKAEQAEKEARGEVIEDKDFGKFKRPRVSQKEFNQRGKRHFNQRDRHSRQRSRGRFAYKNPNDMPLNISDEQNSGSESEEDSHIKLPKFTGMQKELPSLPTEEETEVNEESAAASVSNVPVNEISELSDSVEIIVSSTQENKESDDDDAPVEIPISKLPLDDTIDLLEEAEEDESSSIQDNKVDEENALNQKTELSADMDDFENEAKEEKVSVNIKRENNQRERRPRRPRIPPRRKDSLLEMLLDGEIRHERNVIMQCIRHIVRNNFFKPENKNE